MDRTRIARSAGVFCLALAGVACVAFVALTQGVAPRGGQLQITGFGIGEGYQRAYIPRRALGCDNPIGDRHHEVCRLAVDGRELVTEITHDDHDGRFSACRITYGDREGSCWAGNPVIGGASYALASRVGLGLSEATMADLARQHRLANWHEADWERVAGAVAGFVAVCLALAALLLLPQRLAFRALGACCVGVLTWGFGSVFAVFTHLFAGLVD